MGIKRWDGTQWVSTNTPMTANNITNDSNVSGSKVKDALNTLNTDATTSVHGLMSATDKTKLNGIEANANNYTLPVASSALGGVKSGTDITVDSNGNVSVNDDSHNHIISNVDGLQTALNAKITNPSGGTAGQVLKKTASGEAWGNESPGGVWGQIEGTLSDQDDLVNALSGKQKTIYQGNTAPENPVEGDYWDDPNERGIIATIDNTPTSGSQNVVSSGGVFTALSTVASQCINRWDEMWVNGYLNNGNILYHANNIASLNYIDVRDISSLYFRCAVSGTFTVSCYDSSKNFVQGTGTQFGYNVNSNTIFTIPNGISYIRFYISFASYQNNISINYPSSYTGYYPSKLLKAITNQSAISDAWSAATSYGVDTYCIYDNTLWRCKVQHSNKQPPNTTYWDSVSVGEAITELNTSASISATFNTVYTWSNYATMSTIKFGHVCVATLRAYKCSDGIPLNTTICTVPAGFRPRTMSYDVAYTALYGLTEASASTVVSVNGFKINTDGTVAHSLGNAKIYTAYASFVYFV